MQFSLQALVILSILTFLPNPATAANNRFQHWMPNLKDRFSSTLEQNCSTEFDTYLVATASEARKTTCEATISCILGATTERTKSVLAGASIILGLTPTLLILLGPTAAETALLGLYRPVLAALLNFGSPASNPLRGVEYSAPIDDYIKEKAGRIVLHRRLSPTINAIIVFVELLLAFAAVATVMVTSWELGFRTVSTIYCNDWFGPLLWALLSLVIYVLANITLSSRVSTYPQSPKPPGTRARLLTAIGSEFTTCANHAPSIMTWGNETHLFAGASWLVSVFSVAHLVFGTFWFSTVTFISAGDAVQLTARYMAAAVVCRAICVYELMGLRQVMTVEDQRAVERKDK